MLDPQRILLVRLSHLGDVVHALGVLHALHAAYPAARIAWAIQPEFADLVAKLPGLAHTIPFDRRGGAGAWWRLARELARFRADWTVDAQGNAKSAAVAVLSRAPRRTAPHRDDWQEPWAAWTAREHAAPLRRPARHAMQRMEALVAACVPGARPPLRLDAALDDAERELGERRLDERLARAAAPVLLHLSSPEDVRGWPMARWRALVDALAARGAHVLVLSGPAEAELHRDLARDLGARASVAHWVGQRGLRELAAVFAAAARRGGRLVCCDSGPMHLAAAHGLAVVALAGPQDAARTGPWPLAGAPDAVPAHAVVRSPDAPECAPCLARRCAHPRGPVCMSGIAAGDVLAALDAGR